MNYQNRYLQIVLTVFTFMLLLASCNQSKTIKLKIIETSDVHGAVFPFDLVKNKKSEGSLFQVYTYVKEQRAKKDENVILLDNGDMLQGDPVAYYFNFINTNKEHICAGVMNDMAYDAATVGNHDIEPGHTVYDRFNSEINFPWMAANAVNNSNDSSYFKPYTIIERAGVNVAVLGLITPSIPKWLPPNIYEGIHFNDMIESAKYWINVIKTKEKADIIVGLFHSGVDYTYGGETKDTYKNENASELVAENVPGFNLILVGHDHHGWNKYVINNEGDSVLLAGTTSRAKDLVEVNFLLVKDRQSSYKIVNEEANIVSLNDIIPDSTMLSKYRIYFDDVKSFVSEKIGSFTSPMFAGDAIFGNSEFVDLIQKVQLDYTKADISFTAPMSFSDTIKAGVFTIADLFKLYRFDNLLYTIELSGQEVKDYLEYSYSSWFNVMNSKNDNLLKYVKDKNGEIIRYGSGKPKLAGRYYNFDSAAGIVYSVDVSEPIGQRIKITGMSNGDKFRLNKRYKVAVNSYRGNGGGGQLTNGAGIPSDSLQSRIISISQNDMRWYIMQWIKEKNIITPAKFNNWGIIPKDWWETGKENDLKLLNLN